MKGLVLCIIASFAFTADAADGWGGSVALTSDYLLRGVSQSDGSPAVQFDLHYSLPAGFLAGVWASSVKLNSYESTTAEIDAFVGYRWLVGTDWSAKLTAVHYAYPWNTANAHYDYDELIAGAAYRDRFFATIAYSPNTSRYSTRGLIRDRSAVSYDLVLQQPLLRALSGSAGVGYYDLSELVGTGYWFWNVGLSCDLQPFYLSVSYVGVNNSAASRPYDEGRVSRWSATVMWRF